MVCFTTPGFAEENSPEKADYLIGKSDVLEINVWKEEDLTRTVNVRKDGKISLPLIDDVQAAGRTPLELKETIQQGLSEYIESPTVTVIVQSQESRRYYIIGEVVETGEYELIKDLSVVQAITKASGFTEWADKDEILLLRRSSGKKQRISIDYDAVVSGEKPEQNVQLQADDTIIVP
ncbi:MAG: polysaccharide biosynthesis/export family protein [Desulfohalobiaceae bacterium]